MLEIRAISMKIDPYFTRGRLAGWKKPALKLTKWWRDIINRIDERKAPGYTELGIRLLHVAYPEQAKLETGFARVRKAVKAKGTFGKHDSFIISFHGPPFRRHGVVLAAYDLKNRNERNDFLSHAVSIALEAETTVDSGAVVVGSFAPDPNYPYNIIGFFKARDSMAQHRRDPTLGLLMDK
jgi:hypothetical protein